MPPQREINEKGMVILTTDDKMYALLHGRVCDHSHEHQPIEGTTIVQGKINA